MKKYHIKTGDVVKFTGVARVEWNTEDRQERKLLAIEEGDIYYAAELCQYDDDGPYIEIPSGHVIDEHGNITWAGLREEDEEDAHDQD